jgi:ParB family transcriptional regulator, chromosome partitioning protein
MAVDVSGESAAGIHGGAVVSDIQAQAARRAADGSVIVDLDVNLIDKNPYQTRHFTAEDDEELLALAESIKAQGLIQPITVRPGKDGRYILITGQRRTNATRLAGLATIAAVVRQVSDQQAAEMTVIENLMREDLNVMDQVRAFVMLSTTFQMTQSQIAGRIGSSRESVSNYMRLARLPEEVQGFLKNNELEYSHARLLLRLQDEGVILRVARKAAEEHMSVEALEDLVREKAYPVEGQEKKQGKARWVDPNVRAAQMSLERVLGMRVRIRDSRGKGKILIEYGSLEDFDRLVTVLGGKK